MGFEVDFLGERVGRVMVGFMGKMKKQKVVHGLHATPSHHGPPPLPLAAMPGRRTGPCRTPRTSETMAIHPGPRTSTERPAAITMLGQMDSAAAEFEIRTGEQ
ncbi:hypothetical protein ACQJBY_048588 [Aegilops geniculata]